MNTILIIGIAAVLLFLLWVSRRRSLDIADAGRHSGEESDFFVRLPPRGMLSRCLSVEDVEFVAARRVPRVLQLLLHERRRLALKWLRQTRREAGRLYTLHVRTARHSVDLQPTAELKLLLHFGVFLLMYQALMSVAWLYGPLRTRGFVRSVETLAGVMANLSGRIADSVGPATNPQWGAARGA